LRHLIEANLIYKTYMNGDARSWYTIIIATNWEHEHERDTSWVLIRRVFKSIRYIMKTPKPSRLSKASSSQSINKAEKSTKY